MSFPFNSRRDFLKKSSLLTVGFGLSMHQSSPASTMAKNKLPRWRGFNLLDFLIRIRKRDARVKTIISNGCPIGALILHAFPYPIPVT